jgi:hypothetical protein
LMYCSGSHNETTVDLTFSWTPWGVHSYSHWGLSTSCYTLAFSHSADMFLTRNIPTGYYWVADYYLYAQWKYGQLTSQE